MAFLTAEEFKVPDVIQLVHIPSEIENLPDRISGIFTGSSVFITGVTGYVGKVLLEKILRRGKDVKVVYLLLRSKKGKTPQQRLLEIFDNYLFDALKQQNPEAIKKCVPIAGDVSSVNLGISEDDFKLLENTDFIFHAAATTRFDEKVSAILRSNVLGTKLMLDLAQRCKRLKVFVHVSTAYAFSHLFLEIEEKPYKVPMDPLEILKMLKNDDSEKKFEALLGNFPNWYTFSKALAEELVVKQMEYLPVIITRPGIVCNMFGEPVPGWCNNLQGALAMMVGAGKGVLRTMYGDSSKKASFIPVDLVVNQILVATWHYLNDKEKNIFNVVVSKSYEFTWLDLVDTCEDVSLHSVPFNKILWRPGGRIEKNKFFYLLRFYITQMLPAIVVDLLLFILGYKPFLFAIQSKIKKAVRLLTFYTFKEWNFINNNILNIAQKLNPKERLIYKIDGEEVILFNYAITSGLGLRRYLKETDDMLPRARRNMKM